MKNFFNKVETFCPSFKSTHIEYNKVLRKNNYNEIKPFSKTINKKHSRLYP